MQHVLVTERLMAKLDDDDDDDDKMFLWYGRQTKGV